MFIQQMMYHRVCRIPAVAASLRGGGTNWRRRMLTTEQKKRPDDHEAYKQGMAQLKQTNPILHKMAPTRGGTEAPDAKFLAIFAVVGAAGFYAWFIDPPSKSGSNHNPHE
jgi:hypothetical protein